jgi:hypothetical protein
VALATAEAVSVQKQAAASHSAAIQASGKSLTDQI